MALIEITTFRLRPETDRDLFLAADAVVQSDFSYQQPGIVRRTIADADDGTWLVLTVWDSETAARAAADAFRVSRLGSEFRALIDNGTVHIQTFTPAGAA